MGQSFGVLRAVDRAHTEREESREDPRHGRIGPGIERRRSSAGSPHRRIHSLSWWHEARSRGSAFHARGQARLAIDHPAYIAGAGGTKWLAASAAERHRSLIAVIGAVHTNLLYVVTDPTGRSQSPIHGPR